MGNKNQLSSNKIIDYINEKITNKKELKDIIKQLQKINKLLEGLPIDMLDSIYLEILNKCPVVVNLLNSLVDKTSNIIKKEKYTTFMYTELMPLFELFCNLHNYVLEDNYEESISEEQFDEGDYQNSTKQGKDKLLELDYFINNAANIDDIYAKEIKQYEPLSDEEQKSLFIALRNGDYSAREKLINSNLRLVVNCLRHFKVYNEDAQDLIQEGNLGLMRAIESFDPYYGTKFSTYATHWILQKIRFFINSNNKIYIPIHVKERMNKYKIKQELLTKKLGRPPSIQELAAELNISIEKTIELSILIQNAPISLNELIVNGDNGSNELEYIVTEDTTIISPYELAEKTSLKESISQLLAISGLSEIEKEIIALRYGLNSNSGEYLTLEEISQIKTLTRERIRQIEDVALEKLGKSHEILKFLEYSQDPDLVERKMEIRRLISYVPFSKKYPTFCSYFPEYTEEEVISAAKELISVDLELINKINSINPDNITKIYTRVVRFRLFKIICMLYDILIKKYGKRIIINDYNIKSEATIIKKSARKNLTKKH